LLQYQNSKTAWEATRQKIFSAEGGPKADDAEANPEPAKKPSRSSATQDVPPLCGSDSATWSLFESRPKLDPIKIGSAPARHLCEEYESRTMAVFDAQAALSQWHAKIHFGTKPGAQSRAPENESLAAWLSLLGSSVLPVLYGILGPGAAILRNIHFKTTSSLLSPRDLQLSLQQLALGAIVGACIGLFVSPQTAGNESETSLLGPVALSSSALSFIAGFGVEGVFSAMEGLIDRVFKPPKQKPSG
jgi:hypothetical protein